MFTLGIFTTHIPYIALVIFYAFFWIVGVNKASSGELQSFEKSNFIELSAGDYFSDIDQKDTNSSSNLPDNHFYKSDYIVAFAAFQKLKHKCFHPDKQPQNNTCLSLFSRPPPFVS